MNYVKIGVEGDDISLDGIVKQIKEITTVKELVDFCKTNNIAFPIVSYGICELL